MAGSVIVRGFGFKRTGTVDRRQTIVKGELTAEFDQPWALDALIEWNSIVALVDLNEEDTDDSSIVVTLGTALGGDIQ